MIFTLFRKDPRRPVIDALHQRIATAARDPALYLRFRVPDTTEGRFESLVLHVVLVLRRLGGLPPPAAEIAQDLTDSMFRELDASLRELGVGDMKVPKHMKRLTGSFYGRANAYNGPLERGDDAALTDALERNIVGGRQAAEALARYVLAAEAALAGDGLDTLLTRGPSFPDPGAFVEKGGR
jgi:cytochrome b pre-mRNA-processing protein 3